MDDRPIASRGSAPRDPEELEAGGVNASHEIAPATRLGAVHLTVSDLRRSRRYYQDAIGLETLVEDERRLSLGVGGEELLVLVERAGAQPTPGATGLYHFALLVPERRDLARWLAHAARTRVHLEGMTDHFVSEAIYLSDPDGHGIEIYADRPRSAWEGRVASGMTSLPLDARGLLGELADPEHEPFEGLAAGTVIGHVHLKVASIPETVAFYRDVLGFGLMVELGAQAAFLSAGGYHHHIGANTWESAWGSPPSADAAALRHATILLPDLPALETLRARMEAHDVELIEGDETSVLDPSGIRLRFEPASIGT